MPFSSFSTHTGVYFAVEPLAFAALSPSNRMSLTHCLGTACHTYYFVVVYIPTTFPFWLFGHYSPSDFHGGDVDIILITTTHSLLGGRLGPVVGHSAWRYAVIGYFLVAFCILSSSCDFGICWTCIWTFISEWHLYLFIII